MTRARRKAARTIALPPPVLPESTVPPISMPEQDRLRTRRRGRLPVHYTGTFNLAGEVLTIVDPLAQAVSQLPRPAVVHDEVSAVADAVHEVASVAVGLLAERNAKRRTAHLAPENRRRSVQLLVDLAERPPAPEISVQQLRHGTWTVTLTDLVRPYTGALADYLGAALAPGCRELRGLPSVSERVEAALIELDSAVLVLGRRIDAAGSPSRRTPPTPPADQRRDAARAELATLGIEA